METHREGPMKVGGQVGVMQLKATRARPPEGGRRPDHPPCGLRRGPPCPLLGFALRASRTLGVEITQFVALLQQPREIAHCPVPHGDGVKERGHTSGRSIPLPLLLVFTPSSPQPGRYRGRASRSVAGGPFWHSHGPRPPRLPARSPPGSRPTEAWGWGSLFNSRPFYRCIV